MKPALFAKTMNAVGDCLLARPFVRELSAQYDLSLETPFAQLFSDLPIKRFVRAKTNVPYVTKAVKEFGTHGRWRGAPKDADGNAIGSMRIDYDLSDTAPLTKQMERLVEFRQGVYTFDLPGGETGPTYNNQPYAVIRPIVHRPEFPVQARNPETRYMEDAARILRSVGFRTITIANAPHEDVQALDVDARFESGQLSFTEMMDLVRYAGIVVTPPGFAGLMGVAAQRHTAVIWGARGALDNPRRVFDPRMGLSRLVNFVPKNECPHSTDTCGCVKTINNFANQFKFIAEHAIVNPC